MKKTENYKGHRWTTEEIRVLMKLWADEKTMADIAEFFQLNQTAILKTINRLRKAGIPLARRTRGHKAGHSNKPWTQGDVEYLLRRRAENATSEEIGNELGRSFVAVNAMIQTLRKENVPVAMRGHGVRRLWDVEALKGLSVRIPESNVIEIDGFSSQSTLPPHSQIQA